MNKKIIINCNSCFWNHSSNKEELSNCFFEIIEWNIQEKIIQDNSLLIIIKECKDYIKERNHNDLLNDFREEYDLNNREFTLLQKENKKRKEFISLNAEEKSILICQKVECIPARNLFSQIKNSKSFKENLSFDLKDYFTLSQKAQNIDINELYYNIMNLSDKFIKEIETNLFLIDIKHIRKKTLISASLYIVIKALGYRVPLWKIVAFFGLTETIINNTFSMKDLMEMFKKMN